MLAALLSPWIFCHNVDKCPEYSSEGGNVASQALEPASPKVGKLPTTICTEMEYGSQGPVY